MMVIIMIIALLYSCAQIKGSLTGGPRDTTPPQIDTSKSTPNYSTYFTQRKIELVFDEFITARNLLTKTIISPPLVYIPKLEAKGKKLTVEFGEEEVLKENATYIFNFGDAVVDFHESNAIKNFRFVFSTGPVIDSLSFSGNVFNAFDQKPLSEVYVMLYDDLRDSVVYQEKPFYFAITDKEGRFEFENLRSDTFKVFALKDANLNYIYDQPAELIGYLDSFIYLPDTNLQELSLEMFQDGSTLRFLKKIKEINGELKLLFNEPLKEKVAYSAEDSIGLFFSEIRKDTLVIWYGLDFDTSTVFVLEDTLTIKPNISADFLQDTLRMVDSGRGNNQNISPKDSIELSFGFPLAEVDPGKIVIADTNNVAISGRWNIIEKVLKGKASWSPGQPWEVLVFPGAIKDIYNRTNDTLRFSVTINEREKYGDIQLSIVGLDTAFTYQVSLLNNKKIIEENTINNLDSTYLEYVVLSPGDYQIEILEDRNRNGKWDAGSYRFKRRSEIRHNVTLEKLRENWELEARIDWQELLKDEPKKN